jgi:ketosteroid isomerase-like protein
MIRTRSYLAFVLAVALGMMSASAQTTRPAATTQAAGAVTSADPALAINLMRQEMVDAFNKGDLDRLLSHLDPDVVVTWQNAEVCRGPEAVRAYYNKMMVGPDKRVKSVAANPTVDDRHVYGDWAISWGKMNDTFVLTNGSDFAFDSRFTASIARRGDAWKVTSFHVSVNAFDNPILRIAAKKAATLALLLGAVVGLVIGLIVGMLIKRRGRARAGAGGTA